VEEARRFRKCWGGGMRQSGVIAAAALYALAHNRARIADDHANARVFAERMAKAPGARVDLATVESNIVNIDLEVPADAIAKKAREHGLLINPNAPKRLRALTHLDVSRADVESAADILAKALAG
jgi:threonine aldolase